jgi:hypothetical protein
MGPYPYTRPAFRFLHGDFFQAGFPDGEFDAVVAVSAARLLEGSEVDRIEYYFGRHR